MTTQAAIPLKWYVPFATGDASRVEIPVTSSDATRASQTLGFPPLTMQPPAVGGVPPQGEDFNGAMNQVARVAWWVLNGGGWPYDATFATNSNIGGYPNGAVLQSADFLGQWISTADNNQVNPDTVGTNWVPGYQYGGSSLTGQTGGTVTLTPLQAAKRGLTISGTLTSALVVVYPTWIKDWSITNNTTGAFTVIAKTAAGSGVTIPQNGAPTPVAGDGTNITQLPQNIAAGSQPTHAAQYAQVTSYAAGAYAVRRMIANNNATTPNTQLDTSCDMVVVRNPSTGACAAIVNPGLITNNILTAGPAANGRDVAGAFAASTWIHFYYIWNGTTLATISSASAPPTGPALPSGYTSWAYIGAVFYNSTPALMVVRQRGSWIYYADQQAAVANGTSTVVAAISTSTLTPPNAVEFELIVPNLSILYASGNAAITLSVQVEASHTPWQMGVQATNGTNGTALGTAGSSKRFSALSQGFNYQLIPTSGTGQLVSINVAGYSIPNGGE